MPDIIKLHVGEPDFPTPKHVVEAGSRALRDGYTCYTHTAGLLELRQAISRKLLEQNQIEADPKTEVTDIQEALTKITTWRSRASEGR